MLDDREFERALAWFAADVGERALSEMRRAFESTTGEIEPSAPDFEQRMAHFWEGVMCGSAAEDAPIARYAEAHRDSPSTLTACAHWLRSHRSLFEVTHNSGSALELIDLRGGGAFVCGVAPRDAELRSGDRCDGRLVVAGDRLWLGAGRIFYPEGTRVALDGLLTRPELDAFASGELLDALLRMRGNFLRFESMRAEHVFRVEALRAAPSSAAWAIKPGG